MKLLSTAVANKAGLLEFVVTISPIQIGHVRKQYEDLTRTMIATANPRGSIQGLATKVLIWDTDSSRETAKGNTLKAGAIDSLVKGNAHSWESSRLL